MMPVAILMGCVITTSGRTLIGNVDDSTGSSSPVNFFNEKVYQKYLLMKCYNQVNQFLFSLILLKICTVMQSTTLY